MNDWYNKTGDDWIRTKCFCCGQDGEKTEQILDGCENKGKCNSYNPGFEYDPDIEIKVKLSGEDYIMNQL